MEKLCEVSKPHFFYKMVSVVLISVYIVLGKEFIKLCHDFGPDAVRFEKLSVCYIKRLQHFIDAHVGFVLGLLARICLLRVSLSVPIRCLCFYVIFFLFIFHFFLSLSRPTV